MFQVDVEWLDSCFGVWVLRGTERGIGPYGLHENPWRFHVIPARFLLFLLPLGHFRDVLSLNRPFKEILRGLARLVGLRKSLGLLSAGSLRRVQLVLKLMQPARLLLLDEVTADLDVTARDALLRPCSSS